MVVIAIIRMEILELLLELLVKVMLGDQRNMAMITSLLVAGVAKVR